MISSFFDKTKPINFLVLLGSALLLFWAVTLYTFRLDISYNIFFEKGLTTIALLFLVFLLGNMVKSKKLTQDNSFAMFFFLGLLFSFPEALKNDAIVLSGFFLLLSINRTIALKEEKNHKEKIFESAFWLFTSSLLCEWVLLFLIALFVAIYLFVGKQLRMWLMPLAALFCVLMLSFTFFWVFDATDFFLNHYLFPINLDFFLQPQYGLVTYIIIAISIAALVFGKLGYRRLGRTLSLRIIGTFLILSIVIVIASSNDVQGLEFFSFLPASIFFANFLETFKKRKVKEIVLVTSIILPITVFVFWLLH